METITGCVQRHALQNPDSMAVLAAGRSPLTYAGLAAQLRSVGESLRAAGLAAGDRVAIALPQTAETAVAMIATAAQSVCAPLNPALPPREFETKLTALRASAVVVPHGESSTARSVAKTLNLKMVELHAGPDAGLFSLVGACALGGDAPAAPVTGDTGLLFFTSGTSARPKLVPLTHRNLYASACNIASALELTPADRSLGAMPLHHIHGFSSLLAALVSGGSYIAVEDFSADRFFTCLHELRPSWYSASPTVHRAVLDQIHLCRGDPRASSLRLIRSASAPMPIPLIAQVERAFGVPFLEAYGMTEAGPQIATNRLPPFERRPGSVGTAAGPQVAIMDEAGRLLPPGQAGEIVIRGANVTAGYESNPAANNAAFSDGWLRTGDLGRLDADGYLWITGRLNEIINRGGEKVAPREIEQVLLDHPAVREAIVFGSPDAMLGATVAAVVVLKSGQDPDAEGIRGFASERLARWKVPKRIVFLDRLPFDSSGKIDRSGLALSLPQTAARRDPSHGQAARTAAERRVSEIFAEVLRTDLPGVEDNFFDLGGHSLAAMQVLSRLKQVFGAAPTLEGMFQNPTVAGLAARIGERMAEIVAEGTARLEAGPSAVASIPRRRAAGPARLSSAQQRAFFLDQLGSGAAYTMSASLRLTGPLDKPALAATLDEICRRHEILRTRFRVIDGRPVQIVCEPEAQLLTTIDLTGHTELERPHEAMRLATEEAGRPFDLADGAPFRASLIRLGPEEHVLLLTMHHIVSDGWSIGVLHTELSLIYAALRDGRASPLPELPLQFGDFAEWQQARLTSDGVQSQLGYWRRHLDGLPPTFTLPANRLRPFSLSHRGGAHRLPIDRPLVDSLKGVGRRYDATLFMTLLAAFKTLLFRYTGQDDCFVGTPVANRPDTSLEPLIGFFADTLVLRTALSGDPTFSELLGRVRSTALDAFANQDVPFERIVEALNIPRNPARPPLFQIMFAFQSVPEAFNGSSFDLAPGLTARPFRPDTGTAKFDLTLYLSETSEGLASVWQFNADLFEYAFIEGLARCFKTLLEGIVADPGRRLSELPLLSDAESLRIEAEGRGAETGDVSGQGFVELFEAQVSLAPDAPAVQDGARTVSYRQLNERANRLARFFRGEGVAEGTLVAICLPRSADLPAVLLAVWKAGGAYLPLDPDYPEERIDFMLRESGAALLVTETALLPRLTAASREPEQPLRTICLDTADAGIAQGDAGNPGLAPAPEALAYVIYTSGSTGRPKGAMMSHGNVRHYALAMAGALGLRPEDRYLHTASFSFSSSVRQFAVPLSCGASVSIASIAEIRDPLLLFAAVRERGVSVIDLVPSYSSGCLNMLAGIEPSQRATLFDNRVRLMLSASERLDFSLVEGWRRHCRPGTSFVNMFGQTETTGIVMTYAVPDAASEPATVPVGRTIAATQAQVLDAQRRPVPPGLSGELYIGGAGVGRGYINDLESTAAAFVQSPFRAGEVLYRTGDIARRRTDGVVEIVGRLDDQVKVNGFRIEPGEIEAAIRAFPGVRACFVGMAGEAAASGRRPLMAFVAADFADASSTVLRDFLRDRLPAYMQPQRIILLEQLPRTPSGKIDRHALLAGVLANPPPRTPEVPALEQTDAETILSDVWRKVLGLDKVGIHENFFDLGGNSILSLAIVAHARQAGLEIELKQLYRHQTIGGLAAAISRLDTEQTAVGGPPSVEPETGVLVTVESLRAFGIEALMKAGLDPQGAAIVTEVQLEASLRGQPTHDMVSIPRYATRIATGRINARPRIRIETETDSTARVDGDNGPGQWVSTIAMEIAIRKAREYGVGIATVRRSNHFGAAGHYVWQASKRGLIGLCTTNGPLILAPTGGVTPTFGNNPIGVGIPAGRERPILLDIAMSVAPRGKIGLSVAEGRPLPPGWILDRLGRPSTDLADLASGLGVPIGGHKGYGLALVMEVLAGVLGGAGFGADHRSARLHGLAGGPDYGHFFMALDPARFMASSDFAARVDRLIGQTRGGERADGIGEILIPGEMELRNRERSLTDGVRLRRSTYEALIAYGRKAGLEARLDVAPGGLTANDG